MLTRSKSQSAFLRNQPRTPVPVASKRMTIESSLYPTSLHRPTREPIFSSSGEGSGGTPSSVTEMITIPRSAPVHIQCKVARHLHSHSA
ncbi:hypothetical protein BDR05DRAFT_1007009 [Suillus weaverae]|nr:hypothetical protein BDR05DRAFT_1007009 [Suillus weaverae]